MRIESGHHRILVLRPDGRVVDCRTLTGRQTVFLGALPPGVYIIKAFGENSNWSGKIIIP